MSELLSKIPSHAFIPVLVVTLTAASIVVCSITTLIVKAWQRQKTQELSASLVESMMVNGMTGEEIAQVLRAANLDSSNEDRILQQNKQQ